ncbi:TadE/TadG family type IV pilus assembly protein [Selenomonas ruminantium]|nr:TadE/TadG family type IV pilus assembly protein [Selenomonas ruminantium]
MKSQKGQGLIEFALVLPLFLLVVWGIIYFGFLFSDYLTMSQMARSTAREAVIKSIGKEKKTDSYDEIREKNAIKYAGMINTSLYKFNPLDNNCFSIEEDNENVKVTVKANLNTDDSSMGKAFNILLGDIAPNIEIVYYMYQE